MADATSAPPRPSAVPAVPLDSIRVMSPKELQRFLADFSFEELRQANELWKTYAARKPLVDFEANDG